MVQDCTLLVQLDVPYLSDSSFLLHFAVISFNFNYSRKAFAATS